MGHTAPVLRLRIELLTGHLLPGERVPQPEFGAKTAIRFLGNPAGDQRLCIDDLPVLETRRGIRIGDLFDKGRLVDRGKQTGPLQVVGDDLRDLRAHETRVIPSHPAFASDIPPSMLG